MLVRRPPCVQTVVLTAVIGIPCFCSAAAAIVAVVKAGSSCHTRCLQRLLASFSDSTVSFAASQVPVKRREPHPKFCMAALQQIMLPEALGFRPCDGSHD